MFSRFFIHRPVFACVISIVIVILGAVAALQLPIEQYPDLAPPVVRVEAQYPGASAQVVADTVATILEQEINGVEKMIYMDSTSSPGFYGLNISFEVGTDVDLAAVLVQNRVSIATARLPEDVRRQGVTTRKQSTSIIGVVSLTAKPEIDPKRYDDTYLSNFMSLNIRDEMLRVKGIGGITIIPAKDYSMRIWLDMNKLKARGITAGEVNAAIREQNQQVAAGVVGKQPTDDDTVHELIVTTKGRLTTSEEFAQIIVKREAGSTAMPGAPGAGRVVRLGELAKIELSSRDYSSMVRFNGRPAAIMLTFQTPGGNLVQVADDMLALIKKIRTDPSFPSDLQLQFFYDSSMFIRASLIEVGVTLAEAFVLVFLVVLVFLQSFRATLIPTITIPVALVGTFLFMALFGFTINMLTMFGLILAIGIVVDDAIVVVENVERTIASGVSDPKVATERAMREIFGPVIAITLVLMSVFLPTAGMGGITGQMYRQFALTIAASTFLSAVNALTLSPALCAMLLRGHDPHHKPGVLRRIVGTPARLFNAAFGAVTNAYGAIARLGILLFPLTLALFAAVLGFTYFVYTRVPTGFVPEEDLGFVVVSVQLPDAAAMRRTEDVISDVRDAILKVKGVVDCGTIAGFSLIDGQASNVATAFAILDSWDTRAKAGRDVKAILSDIQFNIAGVREASAFAFSFPAIRGLGNASGFEMRIVARDRTRVTRQDLQNSAFAVMGGAMGNPTTIAFAFSSFRAGVSQLFVDIDREKALKMGVPLGDVFETLGTSLGSQYVNDFNLFGRTFQVTSQAEGQFRKHAEDILKLQVRTASGGMTPLGTLAKITDSFGADRVSRFNLYESATINGQPARGASSGEALAAMEQIATASMPPGVGYEWTAMAYQEKAAQGQVVFIFGLALVLVYLILAAQYESWTTPLAVVLSIPLVILGAMLFVNFRDQDNNIFTQVGLVLLVGLGAKNAILIVEFARQARALGNTLTYSAVSAAKTRFRPILMTSLAFVLGVLPLVFATGAGAAGRRALGTAVSGGMVGVTIMGLFFTPTLWVVVQYLSERVGLAKKPTAMPPVETAGAVPHHA